MNGEEITSLKAQEFTAGCYIRNSSTAPEENEAPVSLYLA